jgi:hypothetical protein
MSRSSSISRKFTTTELNATYGDGASKLPLLPVPSELKATDRETNGLLKDAKVKDAVLEEYRKQDDDLRAVSYKLLVESFNSKYKNLTEDQKELLREYINNINNTGKLNQYVNEEVTKLVDSLKEVGSKISDKVTKIKLAETISNVRKIKSVKKIKEQHLSAMMMTYELLGELKQSIKK